MTEAEICALFTEEAQKQGWTVYPEVGDWDLVLVWEGEAVHSTLGPPTHPPVWTLEPGVQVAVEAKVRASVDALAQAMERNRYKTGPDFKAILAPKITRNFRFIASKLGILSFGAEHYTPLPKPMWDLETGEVTSRASAIRPNESHRTDYTKRLWLPPVVPQGVVAGVPCPSPLSPWRVKALKLCNRLRTEGYVTSRDFRELDLSMTRWRQGRHPWLEDSGDSIGRLKKFVLPENPPSDFPDIGWEADRDAIAALKMINEED